MEVGLEESPHHVLVPSREQPNRDLRGLVDHERAHEGLLVHFRAVAVDVEPETVVVEEVQPLGRGVSVVGVDGSWRKGGHELSEEGDQVDQDHDHRADHGQPVLAEAPPHQLPLGGHIDFVPLPVVGRLLPGFLIFLNLRRGGSVISPPYWYW